MVVNFGNQRGERIDVGAKEAQVELVILDTKIRSPAHANPRCVDGPIHPLNKFGVVRSRKEIKGANGIWSVSCVRA
jgi:hypothetical protein